MYHGSSLQVSLEEQWEKTHTEWIKGMEMVVLAGEICCMFPAQRVALKRKVRLVFQSEMLQVSQRPLVMMTLQSNYSDFQV